MKIVKRIIIDVEYCAQCPHQDNMFCIEMDKEIPLWNMYHTFPKWCEKVNVKVK